MEIDNATLNPDAPFPQRPKYISYTPQQWENVRTLIERLYKDERRKLTDVMDIMARNHGHYATQKMYKARIQKWGLDKKKKGDEMLFIFHQHTRRSAIGKKTRFELRGRVITQREITRFFKRKGGMPTSLELAHLARAVTPPYISYRTPSPHPSPTVTNAQLPAILSSTANNSEPIHESNTCDNYGIFPISADALGHVLCQTSQISMPLSLPQVYYVPESLFRNIQTYIEGSIASGTWTTNNEGDLANLDIHYDNGKSMHYFGNYCVNAAKFALSGSFSESIKSLSYGCSLLYKIIFDQQPSTLRHLFRAFLILQSYDCHSHIKILQSYIGRLASVLSKARSNQETWKKTCQLLGNVEKDQFEDVIFTAWNCLNKILASNLGATHEETICSCSNYLTRTSRRREPAAIESTIRPFLSQIERVLGPLHAGTLDVLHTLCQNLFDQERYTECLMAAEDLRQRALLAGFSWAEYDALNLRATVHRRLGQSPLAQADMENLLILIKEKYGATDPCIIQAYRNLQQLYQEVGRTQEADVLMVKITELMPGPDDVVSDYNGASDFHEAQDNDVDLDNDMDSD